MARSSFAGLESRFDRIEAGLQILDAVRNFRKLQFAFGGEFHVGGIEPQLDVLFGA